MTRTQKREHRFKWETHCHSALEKLDKIISHDDLYLQDTDDFLIEDEDDTTWQQ